jgi:hypothetical protein
VTRDGVKHLSGPHPRDYFFLLDGTCDRHAGITPADMVEVWIDDDRKYVWYVVEGE